MRSRSISKVSSGGAGVARRDLVVPRGREARRRPEGRSIARWCQSVATYAGALSRDRRIWDTASAESGVIDVPDVEEMADVLAVLRTVPRHRQLGRVFVDADGGGEPVLSTGAFDEADVQLARLSAETQPAIDRLAPPAAPRAEGQNPIVPDTAGGLENDPVLSARCAAFGAPDDSVDTIVVSGAFGGYRASRSEELDAIDQLAAVQHRGTPVLVHSGFASDEEAPVQRLRLMDIRVFPTARRLTRALAKVGPATPAVPAALTKSARLTEDGPPSVTRPCRRADAAPGRGGWLRGVGRSLSAVPPGGVRSRPASSGHGQRAGALLLETRRSRHLTKVGGGRCPLNLGRDAIEDATHELWRRFPGRTLVLMPMLQPGASSSSAETPDPTFGPYVTVGRSGVSAELNPDVAIGLVPLGADRGTEPWCSLRCAPLLCGWRARPGVNLRSLADLTVAMSTLAVADPLLEIECNPVIGYPGGYAISDVRAVRRESRSASGLSAAPEPVAVVETPDRTCP